MLEVTTRFQCSGGAMLGDSVPYMALQIARGNTSF